MKAGILRRIIVSVACLDDGRIFIPDPMYNSYEIYDGSDFSFIE